MSVAFLLKQPAPRFYCSSNPCLSAAPIKHNNSHTSVVQRLRFSALLSPWEHFVLFVMLPAMETAKHTPNYVAVPSVEMKNHWSKQRRRTYSATERGRNVNASLLFSISRLLLMMQHSCVSPLAQFTLIITTRWHVGLTRRNQRRVQPQYASLCLDADAQTVLKTYYHAIWEILLPQDFT